MTSQHLFMKVFPLLTCLIALASCSQTDSRPGGADSIPLLPGTCPLPEFLPTEDTDRIKKFGANVASIPDVVGSAGFEVDLKNKVTRDYPSAEDANRLFALGYSACLRCRLAPSDISGCAANFDAIILSFTEDRVETDQWDNAEAYKDKMLGKLK